MQPVFKGQLDDQTSSDQMMFSHIYVPIYELVMKGYASCGDTFSGIVIRVCHSNMCNTTNMNLCIPCHCVTV